MLKQTSSLFFLDLLIWIEKEGVITVSHSHASTSAAVAQLPLLSGYVARQQVILFA